MNESPTEDLTLFNKRWDIITNNNFTYFNTLTRAPWDNIGRITQWVKEDRLHKAIKFEPISPQLDRFMVCGSLDFNKEFIEYFSQIGLSEGNTSTPGDYLVEKAFVEK